MAIGVIVIGELFGFIGLFVAVPILSLIVILVDELWVTPIEDRRRIELASDGELAHAVVSSGEIQKVRRAAPQRSSAHHGSRSQA